jgi:type II secretory pathway pseudopilin PulG
MYKKKNIRAFTFLELAISLIIISLLISGAFVGKQIIIQARIKNSITQLNELQNSIRAFRLTYGSLPGDIANATVYWEDTVDGNGDGRLQLETEGEFMWFTHLLLAELSGGFNKDRGKRPMLSFAAWSAEFVYDDQWGKYKRKNILRLHDYDNDGDVEADADKIHAIDLKVDDGRPYTGKIMSTSKNDQCDVNGNIGDIKCCANYFSMLNPSFNKLDQLIKKTDYSYGSENCSYLFVELGI